MNIVVSAQEQELRVRLTAAMLERKDFDVRVLDLADIGQAPRLGADAVVAQLPTEISPVERERLREVAAAVPVIVVYATVSGDSAQIALQLGARGILLSTRSARTFQSAVLSVFDGGSWVDPVVMTELLRGGIGGMTTVAKESGEVFRHTVSTAASFAAQRFGERTRAHEIPQVSWDSVEGRQMRPPVAPGAGQLPAADGTNRFGEPARFGEVDVSTGHAGSSSSASHNWRQRPPLTERESQVASLIGRGLTNQEISAALGVDESTVKTHIGSILRKVKLRDRLQVALWFHGLPIGLPQPTDVKV
jgi:DNA-binding NarL/FixJ family response regulator